jgi:hypothetical protein
MCQSKAQGGKRCDHDTSENRRLRRKAAKLRTVTSSKAKGPVASRPLTAGLVSPSIARLKQEAESLRKDIHNAPTDPIERSAYDAAMEVRLTQLGVSIGEEADKIAKVKSRKKIDKLCDDKDNELFIPLNKRRRELEAEKEELIDEWAITRADLGGFRFRMPDTNDIEQIEDPEKRKNAIALRNVVNKLEDLNAKQDKAYEESNDYKDAFFTENRNKLSVAYRTIISQIRPVGGNIGWSENSDTEVAQIMQESVGKDYPSSWLKLHNDNNPEEIVLGKADRPGYNPEYESETETGPVRVQDRRIHFLAEAPLDQEKAVFIISNLEGVSVRTYDSIQHDYRIGEDKKVVGIIINGDDYEVYNPDIHGAMQNTKPEGDGWEYRTAARTVEQAMAKSTTPEEFIENLQKKEWMRPIQTTSKVHPHLTLFSDEAREDHENTKSGLSFDELNTATAYHEFGHRMEQVFPENILARQEKAFLKRRTGKTDENMYADLKVINPYEVAHEAGFTAQYTGRDYINGKNYEIFTTGIEALYGKNYGGITGNSRSHYKGDLDHRGFTLGALATL